MSYFAAVLTRRRDTWTAGDADLSGCESLEELADVLRDEPGDVRLLVIEQDDEYAALVRLDDDEDEPRAFLSDGHAADSYPLAALVAEELAEIGGDELEGAPLADDTAPEHDSTPFGDAGIADDLGTPAVELVAMCEHEGTLPIDLLLSICEKAGCAEVFEDLRG